MAVCINVAKGRIHVEQPTVVLTQEKLIPKKKLNRKAKIY
jgi:hypothetical protein